MDDTAAAAAATPSTLKSAGALRSFLNDAPRPWKCVWATAEWCTPCKRLQPCWSDIAEPSGENYDMYAATISFAVADLTDESDEGLDGTSLSEVLHIQTLPTFVLFDREGQEVGRAEGAAHKRPAQRLHKVLKLTRGHAETG